MDHRPGFLRPITSRFFTAFLQRREARHPSSRRLRRFGVMLSVAALLAAVRWWRCLVYDWDQAATELAIVLTPPLLAITAVVIAFRSAKLGSVVDFQWRSDRRGAAVALVLGGLAALCFLGVFARHVTFPLAAARRIAAERLVAIERQADVIRQRCATPLEQIACVQQVMLHIVEYDRVENIWGYDHTPRISEIIAERAARGWIYPRGDCKTRAVYMAALLQELGIPYRFELSVPLQHCWLSAQVGCQWYSLGAIANAARTGWQAAVANWGDRCHLISPPDPAPPVWIPRGEWNNADGALLGFALETASGHFVPNNRPISWDGATTGADARKTGPLASTVAGFPYGDPL